MALPNIIQNHTNDINTIKSTYLPLSGGLVYGSIKSSVNTGQPVIQYSNINDTSEHGGELWLFSSQHTNYKGGALIRCYHNDNTLCKDFWFNSDGYFVSPYIKCGEITSINDSVICRDVDDGSIHICAAPNYSNGAIIRLRGNNHAETGEFTLWAGGTTYGKVLRGTSSGGLTWVGQKVLCLADERSGIHQTSDGFTIQWGGSAGQTTVTFPRAFSTTPKVYTTNKSVTDSSCNATTYVTSVSNTSFNTYKIRGNASNQVVDGGSFDWLAIGHCY